MKINYHPILRLKRLKRLFKDIKLLKLETANRAHFLDRQRTKCLNSKNYEFTPWNVGNLIVISYNMLAKQNGQLKHDLVNTFRTLNITGRKSQVLPIMF